MPLPHERFKVFISHATQPDGELVNWIADALDRLHIRAYVYEQYSVGGQNRFQVIQTMIRACPYFVVLLTADGIASQWVNQEIGYAVAVGKAPIPIIEVNAATNRRFESKGFVELHDPIPYYRNKENLLMVDIIYTFKALLTHAGGWRDAIFLSCACGYDFDAPLTFDIWWSQYSTDHPQQEFPLTWKCPKCGRNVEISFPDCHLIRQIRN